MNAYYDSVKRLFLAGKLSDTGLSNAVSRGWITEEQAEEIRAAEGGTADA